VMSFRGGVRLAGGASPFRFVRLVRLRNEPVGVSNTPQ